MQIVAFHPTCLHSCSASFPTRQGQPPFHLPWKRAKKRPWLCHTLQRAWNGTIVPWPGEHVGSQLLLGTWVSSSASGLKSFCSYDTSQCGTGQSWEIDWWFSGTEPQKILPGPARTYTYGGFQKQGYPNKSSIFIGCSIINHLFWGISIYGNLHICSIYIYITPVLDG